MHSACLSLGLKNSLCHLFCLGCGLSPVKDQIVLCLIMSSSRISLTVFGAGRDERCCCSVISCSDAEIYLPLEMTLSFTWQAEVLGKMFIICINWGEL